MTTSGTLFVAVHPLPLNNTVPLKQLVEMSEEDYKWSGKVEGEFVVR